MPSKIDPAVKARALRMIAERRGDYPSDTALAVAVAGKVGVGRETVRRWLVQADIDTGARSGASTDQSRGDEGDEGVIQTRLNTVSSSGCA